MRNQIPALLFGLAALVLPLAQAHGQSPCPTVPGSGCPGAPAPQCAGSKSIGQTLTITCLDSGRGNPMTLFMGACAAALLPIGGPLTCPPAPTTCGFAVDLLGSVVVDGRQPAVLPIPNDPGLVGLSACFQCLEVAPSRCALVSAAIQVTIDP